MRVKLGELPLILDDNISKLAQMKVDDMIARKYQEHRDPDGNYIDGFAQKRGFSFDGNIAENIGYGSVSDISLQDGLEES